MKQTKPLLPRSLRSDGGRWTRNTQNPATCVVCLKVKNAIANSVRGMGVLEEGRDAILNGAVVVGLTGQMHSNEDLKEVRSGACRCVGGGVF